MAALTPDSVDGRGVDPGTDDVLPAGTLLDSRRYRLGGPLGRGGFGITYEAQDLRLRRPVAIKELFPDQARRDGVSVVVPGAAAEAFARARQRFLREATTLARFGHPSIVRIFAVFEEHGTAYLVLERLHGQTLADELRGRRGPFSEAEALDAAGQVAAALAVVHRAGVLHRDVSPSNLVRTADGRLVLIDFGLARPFADDHTTSMTRIVTPGYAPPEQYAGAARFSGRADVYALGATLHRLLSGRVPPDPGARAQGREPDPLWRVNPTVTRRVSDAVAAALALEPQERPASVWDLLELLGVPTDDLDIRALPPAELVPDDLAPLAADLDRRAPPAAPAPDEAGPDERTAFVAPRTTGEADRAGPVGPAPVWSTEAPADDPADRATEHVARGDRGRTEPAPSERGPGDHRPTVRPASHVVPAPPAGSARGVAPVGAAVWPVQGPSPARVRHAAGPPPRGRAWVTLPLGLAATSLASAQPATVTLIIGLVVAPVLATVGDRILRPDRNAGWAVGWWLRNVLVGAVRSLGAVALLAFGLCVWYGTEAYGSLGAAGPWVLRATGVAAGGIMCLSVSRGGPGFRSHLALDALATRLLPRGRLSIAAAALVLVCLGIAAAGLWFQPEAWPLGG